MKSGTNIAVFILFFGISLLKAFRDHNWILALFWVAMAFVFLFAGNVKKQDDGASR